MRGVVEAGGENPPAIRFGLKAGVPDRYKPEKFGLAATNLIRYRLRPLVTGQRIAALNLPSQQQPHAPQYAPPQ